MSEKSLGKTYDFLVIAFEREHLEVFHSKRDGRCRVHVVGGEDAWIGEGDTFDAAAMNALSLILEDARRGRVRAPSTDPMRDAGLDLE